MSLTKYHYVYMYSLKSDSWRKVESTEDLHLASDYMGPCESPLDELYFLEGDMSINPQTYSILRFDLKSEKFVEIAAPSLENPYSFFFCFMVKRGCIHVWKVYNDTLSYRKIREIHRDFCVTLSIYDRN